MNAPTISVPVAPRPIWRRAFDWWLVQLKHVWPPTLFFFIGFNLILFTRWMTLQEHGIPFTNFFAATLAALLVGKAVLVVDNSALHAPLRPGAWESSRHVRPASTGIGMPHLSPGSTSALDLRLASRMEQRTGDPAGH